MAKATRGLPSTFSLELPDDVPVDLGDFLDEPPPAIPMQRQVQAPIPQQPFRPEIVPDRRGESNTPPKPQKITKQSAVIRCQLNLTPKSKTMLEEMVKYVQTYSPEPDTRTSEVFQAIVGLLHGAMGELELSQLPRRGAWGSVTAKNFPGALSDAFEQAIVRTAGRRGA